MPALFTCQTTHAQKKFTAEVSDIMHMHMEGSHSKDGICAKLADLVHRMA